MIRKWLNIILIGIVVIGCNSTSEDKKKEKKDDIPKAKPETEITKLTKAIVESPGNPELLNKRAHLYLQEGELKNAFADVRKAILEDSSKAEYYGTLADVHFALGKPSETKKILEKAIRINDQYIEGYAKLAELAFYYREYQKTFDYIKKALEVNKKFPKAYFIRGMALKEIGHKEKAIEDFQTVIDLDPEYLNAYMELGLIYSTRKDPLAEAYFNGALNINPQSKKALYALGMYYQENNKPEQAINTYNTLLSVDSTFIDAYYNIGYVNLVLIENFNKAKNYFSKVIELDTANAKAYYNRGHSYELMGKYNQAREDFKQALEYKHNYDMAIDGLNRLDNIQYK